jgi:hypothetical protein
MNILSAIAFASLFVPVNEFIDFDRKIGAHGATCPARGAFILIDELGNQRPRFREFLPRNLNAPLRTKLHAQGAPFADVVENDDLTFRHIALRCFPEAGFPL